MIHIKEGVTLPPGGITLELLDLLLEASALYSRYGYVLVVTSLGDGVHRPGSLHSVGRAADMRTKQIRIHDIGEILRALKTTMGLDYDIVLEKDHIHGEYDPKSTPD